MSEIGDILANPITAQAEALNVEGLNSLMEECIYQLPGCSDLMLRKELQKTLRDFCQRVGNLTQTDQGTVTHTEPELTLCREEFEVYLFIEATLDTRAASVKIKRECGCVTVKFSLSDDDNDLDGNPNEHTAAVKYSWIPRIGSEAVPLCYATKWAPAIISGTLFRLMAMTKKPWSDVEMAKVHAFEYQKHLNNATINKLTNGVSGDMHCRAPLPFI